MGCMKSQHGDLSVVLLPCGILRCSNGLSPRSRINVFIHTEISGGGLCFLASFVYVQPCWTSKAVFWDALKVFCGVGF